MVGDYKEDGNGYDYDDDDDNKERGGDDYAPGTYFKAKQEERKPYAGRRMKEASRKKERGRVTWGLRNNQHGTDATTPTRMDDDDGL